MMQKIKKYLVDIDTAIDALYIHTNDMNFDDFSKT